MRILIADDHFVIRWGLRCVLEQQLTWQVVAEARDGIEAIAQTAAHHPDVAVLDQVMPGVVGREVVRRITDLKARVLMYSGHQSEVCVRDAFEAGALGYVLKGDGNAVLIDAIKAVWAGTRYLSPQLSVAIGSSRTDHLTRRERAVACGIAEGHTSKSIARNLGVSLKTVETHRGNLMRKMEFRCAADVVRYAVRNQIIEA